jgi:hypothetical protein
MPVETNYTRLALACPVSFRLGFPLLVFARFTFFAGRSPGLSVATTGPAVQCPSAL